jgi:hypothetical protein
MNAKSVLRLKEEVALWATETRAVVSTCRQLVEYFGSKKELTSWDAALKAPLEWVEVVVAHTPRRKRSDPTWPRSAGDVAFSCSESTARILSPVVEIVGGPWPHFVYTIRKIVPKAEQGRQLYPCGMFSVSFADAVTQPLWRTYRHLAPDEWKSCFPEKPANSRPEAAGASRRR